jgi:hypothetical protein
MPTKCLKSEQALPISIRTKKTILTFSDGFGNAPHCAVSERRGNIQHDVVEKIMIVIKTGTIKLLFWVLVLKKPESIVGVGTFHCRFSVDDNRIHLK